MSEQPSPVTPWRPVVGFEGVYEVSFAGSVRRIGKQHGATVGRLIKHYLGFGGYPVVKLHAGHRNFTRYVHRLVAAAFLGPCPADCEVNHKDRDHLNPSADNLEYVTRSENMKHSFRNGVVPLRGEEKLGHKLTAEDVLAIRASNESTRPLGRRYGVCHSTIVAIRRRKKWTHL